MPNCDRGGLAYAQKETYRHTSIFHLAECSCLISNSRCFVSVAKFSWGSVRSVLASHNELGRQEVCLLCCFCCYLEYVEGLCCGTLFLVLCHGVNLAIYFVKYFGVGYLF